MTSSFNSFYQLPFFYVVLSTDVAPPDWCTTTFYNNWDSLQVKDSVTETNVTKTIYDPSPSGFMVAPRAATNGMTSEIASFESATKMNPIYPVNTNSGCIRANALPVHPVLEP